jgi:hypothetical protein
MTHLGFALRLLTLLGAMGQALAQAQTGYQVRIDYPSGGMLHHQTEPSSVWFECSPVDAERIRCQFTQFQAYVVRGAWPADQQLAAFERDPPSAEECADARAALAGVPRTRPPEPPGNPDQRDGAAAVVEYCETGRTEALRALYARQYDRWQKTCTIAAHHYTQTLRRVSSSPRRWVTEQPPGTECRIHQVSEFYEESDGLRYVAAYKVLNRSARDGVMDCNEIHDHELVYGPSNATAGRMTCETIQYSLGCSSPEFPCLLGAPEIAH